MVKLSPNQRGLGYFHKVLRLAMISDLKAAEAAGEDLPRCHFCGNPMRSDQKLDLDHTADRKSYRGLAHAGCNRSDGASKGNKARKRRNLRKW